MAQLYPPIIEGTLPAFSHENPIIIPFGMNKAVSFDEIAGFKIKIKTIQSNSYIKTFDSTEYSINDSQVLFHLNENEYSNFNVGQFYKVQMAYVNKSEEVGIYSTVGVIKYTTTPAVQIEELENSNAHIYKYTGKYSQKDGDISEKVYSYQFNLLNENKEVINSSGWLIHNNLNNDEAYQSIDIYELNEDLQVGHTYFLNYEVKTINGLHVKSKNYEIKQQSSVDSAYQIKLNVENNIENGYINLTMESVSDTINGRFRVVRSSEKDNYTFWLELGRCVLSARTPSAWEWKDFLIEHGVKYKYGIQQYNSHEIYSNRIESDIITADFDYAFLLDGKRQLKLSYNPKVSSFKDNILETKVDTIGSKYPFFFRNGNVKYKQFPISALLSRLSDEEFLFINDDDKDVDTELTGENIALEKQYKLEVLEWLNNGEEKIFKSPNEGNYIVRLMNSSLTPLDQLGRMLHNFSTTAYEVADYNNSNIEKFEFVNDKEIEFKDLIWETVKITSGSTNLLGHAAAAIRVDDGTPGQTITLIPGGTTWLNQTGSLELSAKDNLLITSVRSNKTQGNLTYGYYRTSYNRFDDIIDVDIKTTTMMTFIDACNIYTELENIKFSIKNFIYVRCYPKTENTIAYIRFSNDEKEKIQLSYDNPLELKDIIPDTFILSDGAVAEVIVQLQEAIYQSESDSDLSSLKSEYQTAEDNLKKVIIGESTKFTYEEAWANYKAAQADYFVELETKLIAKEANND